MKNQSVRDFCRALAAEILATLLATFWAVMPATGADVQMVRSSDKLIEIRGDRWRLKYGDVSREKDYRYLAEPSLAIAGDHAFFSHGAWLRMIDTKKGIVVGRWHFPGDIVGLVPEGKQIQVKVRLGDERNLSTRQIKFDPDAPDLPYWPTGSLILSRMPLQEATWPGMPGSYLVSFDPKIPEQQAREIIPEFKEAIRRDPLSPMFQACLGRLLLDTGDPGASAIFRQALQVPTTDFTELLPLSAFFDAAGERELARVAFERGYRDFWEKVNDPRLLTFIITRLIYYGAPRWKQDNPPKYGIRLSEGSPPPELQRELLERFYLFSPHCEWAETAYLVYASQVLKQGRTEESRLWSARAEEVKSAGLFPISLSILLAFDRSILAMGASITAALLYFLILRARYRPQHRLMRAAQLQKERGVRRFLPFSAAYWSLNQRIGFFTIAAVAWLAAGVVSNVMTCIAKVSSAPVTFGSGSLAGPETAWFLESQLPKSPARDFILAMAYQQDGRTKDAESLYRSLPEFAESWNNLGVLLKNAGRAEEARKAFERALQIDPTLAEAALNLGHRPKTLWTELHEKYLPGRPMMTPPKREQILEAFFGGPITKIVLRTLAGPFSGRFAPGEIFFEEGVWLTRRSTIVMTVLLVVLLAIAASILLLVPAREVTQPPRSTQFLWEILFPGTSPVWSFLGGLVTVAWCCFLLQWIVLFRRGIPYPVTSLAMPNLMFSGVPGNVEDTRRLINPSWIWIYAMPVLLIVLNFILVMRRRRIEASSTSVG